MGPIETRVFRRIGTAGNLGTFIDQVTADVNTFVATKDPNNMINIEYLVGQSHTGAQDLYYIAIVTYLVP